MNNYQDQEINFNAKPRFFNSKIAKPENEQLTWRTKNQNEQAEPGVIQTTKFNTEARDYKPPREVQTQNGYQAKKINDKKVVQQVEEYDDDIDELATDPDAGIAIDTPINGEFTSFPEINKKTVENLKEKGYKDLFPIQQHCFYPIYQRNDVVARDLTGSGKTFAFGLPVVEYLRKKKQLGTGRIQAIILAPTRELAIQVSGELKKLRHNDNDFQVATIYGGVNIEEQTRLLNKGVEIVVATTGRMLDHMDRGNVDLSDLKTVVLDEADQMLKLGFKEDVDSILDSVSRQAKERAQICLFSATIPSWVRNIARSYMQKGFKIVDLAQDLKNKTAKHVNHLAIECPYSNRLGALADVLLCYGSNAKTIVFTQTKQDANGLILTDKIKQDMEVMHGDIAQNQREVTIKRFKEGKFQVLVATDVASRGLDIPNVDLVIQLEPPKDTETYIHRSGRTARAGKHGTCITFYMKKTYELIQKIEEQAGIKFKRIGIPQAEDIIKASSKGILKNLQDVNEEVVPFFQDLARILIDQQDGDAERALQIALAYCSGHYKQALTSKSLLTGEENKTTIQMTVYNGRLNYGNCRALLKKYWDPRINDQIRGVKQFANGKGVVFDIASSFYEGYVENFERLKETGEHIDFETSKCMELPDLEEDVFTGFGGNTATSSNWRTNNAYENDQKGSFTDRAPTGGSRGGYRGRGNRGNYAGDRGGFQSYGDDRTDNFQKRGGYNQEGSTWRGRGGNRGGRVWDE